MDEARWLTASAADMLRFLRDSGIASPRKLRLFACACCRRLGISGGAELCERYADGLLDDTEVEAVRWMTRHGGLVTYKNFRLDLRPRSTWVLRLAVVHDPWSAAWETALATANRLPEVQRSFLHDLFGNPFRPIEVSPAWLAWEGETVPRMAETLYRDQALDDLPCLADALEDAGCTQADLLCHLRGPGPHVRGCFALDAILRRS